MSAKKRKDNLTYIATIRKMYIEELNVITRGCPNDPLWQFSRATDTPHQIAALRQVVKQLHEGCSPASPQLSLDILISTYLDTPPKHPLKRALASSLQSLVSCDVDVDVSLGRHLVEMCGTTTDSMTMRRKLIDNIASLTENFPLGEQCLVTQSLTVLEFLESSLTTFIDNIKWSGDTAMLSEHMYHCLVTVQMVNKLLHKICHDDGLLDTLDYTKSLSVICHRYFQNLYTIVLNDRWMLDCRAACGLGLPLVYKLLCRNNTSQFLHHILLRETNVVTPDVKPLTQDTNPLTYDYYDTLSATNWTKLSPSSYTCVLCGMLAMLDGDDLLEMCCHDNTAILLTCITGKLFENIHRLTDPGSKLLASRALTQLANRASSLLDGTSKSCRFTACFHDNGDLLQLLVNYAWTRWEDPVDAIRREVKGLFDATLKCHLKTIHSETSAYLEDLLRSLLAMSWHMKGKYGPLASVVAYTGASRLLELEPALPRDLLHAMMEQTLACHVGELFEKLFVTHLRELRGSGKEGESYCEGKELGDRETALTRWHVVWLEPMLEVLCTGSASHRKYIVEYLLPKLLKHSPGSIHYITQRLGAGSDPSSFGTLVTCLKQAKTLGVLKAKSEVKDKQEVKDSKKVKDRQDVKDGPESVTLWNGILAMSMLEQALVHQDEQTRLDAYGMLCEDPRITEVVTKIDLGLIEHFLPFNINNQSPAFRQRVVALTKKLFVRLKESARVLVRQHKAARKQAKSDSPALTELSYYKVFLQWLCQLIFRRLHPEAAFPARTTALSLLTTMMLVFGADDRSQDSLEEEFYLVDVWTPPRVQTLLECLLDTFEENKVNAFAVLSAVPQSYLFLQDFTRLEHLLEASLRLASSTRPQDCNSAAFLLRVITQQPLLYDVISARYTDQLNIATGQVWTVQHVPMSEGVEDTTQGVGDVLTGDRFQETCLLWGDTCVVNDVMGRCCIVLFLMLGQLTSQVSVARRSLVHAASTRPMYPTMHCIRYLLRDVNMKCIDGSPMWRDLLEAIINVCFQVATVVAPVVTNCSPEGFIPDDLCLTDMSLSGDASLSRDDMLDINKVSLMPEYLTVCCWRSAKEASLLLGQLLETTPIIDPNVDTPTSESCKQPQVSKRSNNKKGLVSVAQVHVVGGYFISQLLRSRHRGAFELAYAGFVKMTAVLWESTIDELRELPKLWLDSVMADIRSCDPDSHLCATRRSAGVPFYIQALVSTEPVSAGRVCLRAVISELLSLARSSQPEPQAENTAQVHAVNVLRALYRDTRLASDVFPFIADGLQVAVLGCGSIFWAIRNSSSLLFSALITRIFGVKRSKEDSGSRNCLTGRVFFSRFPSLYKFLLVQLIEATQAIGAAGKLSLHPSLFPSLLVLGRLLPSMLEGADSTHPLAPFLPHIIRCATSPVYKIRVMAASALGPLVARGEVTAVIASLLESLPSSAANNTNQNHVHGVLLQVLELLRAVSAVKVSGLVETTATGIETSHWLSTTENACFLTKTVYMKVVYATLSHNSPDQSEAARQHRRHLEETLVTTALSYIDVSDIKPPSSPGEAEFFETMAAKLLQCIVVNPSLCEMSCQQLIVCLLSCPHYEVRLQTLLFLLQTLPQIQGSGMWNDGNTQFELSRTGQLVEGHVTTHGLLAAQHVQVFTKVVTMATGEESHPECLAKVLEVLCRHPLTALGPWRRLQDTWTTEQMLHYAMTLPRSARDEVRCAAVELTGRLMACVPLPSKSRADSHVLCEWVELLRASCSTHHSQQLRRATAAALLHSCHLLCATSAGEDVLELWSVVMRLLEDEDDSVRQTMATVVHRLHCHIPAHLTEMCRVELQPEMTLMVCLSMMTQTWHHVSWRHCLRLLLCWVTQDLQPPFFTPENSVRLFDKGEMNTFSDPVTFVDLVANHLNDFLLSSIKTASERATEKDTFYDSRDEEPLVILTQESEVLLKNLAYRLDQTEVTSPQSPFVDAGQYREDAMALYRSVLALQCLVRFTQNNHQVAHMCHRIYAKLTQTGGSLNVLLASVLQQDA